MIYRNTFKILFRSRVLVVIKAIKLLRFYIFYIFLSRYVYHKQLVGFRIQILYHYVDLYNKQAYST